MAVQSKVYIAGIGLSSLQNKQSGDRTDGDGRTQAALISAATKALLEAALTYDHVTHGIVRTTGHNANKVFAILNDNNDEADIHIDQLKDSDDELSHSYNLFRNHGAQCVLLMSIQKSTAISLILISEDRLWRHPYLKDTAVILDKLDKNTQPNSDTNTSAHNLQDLCQTVWTLRGWTNPTPNSNNKTNEYFYSKENSKSIIFRISRADNQKIPEWKDIEHKQDGRDRLGFNPAVETDRDVWQEDFEGVLGTKSEDEKSGQRKKGKEEKEGKGGDWFRRRGGDTALLAKL